MDATASPCKVHTFDSANEMLHPLWPYCVVRVRKKDDFPSGVLNPRIPRSTESAVPLASDYTESGIVDTRIGIRSVRVAIVYENRFPTSLESLRLEA